MYIFSQNHVTRAKLTRSEYADIHPDFKGKLNGKPSVIHKHQKGIKLSLTCTILHQMAIFISQKKMLMTV